MPLDRNHNFSLSYRLRWISFKRVKYTQLDFIGIGWLEDDLPLFGQINYIAFIEGMVLFCVSVYQAYGFDNQGEGS